MKQEFSSANTSINSTKLPAVYRKIDWKAVGYEEATCGGFGVLDYGCGKYFSHIEDFLDDVIGAEFFPFDKFNQPKHVNEYSEQAVLDGWVNCCVCSNVLNVIKEDEIIQSIANQIVEMGVPYFVSIYDGDKSGEGRKTKEDCYQRNEKVQEYLKYFPDAVIRHGVITNAPEYIK